MDSSDEDFLPDPERSRKRKRPPDRIEVNERSQKRKIDAQANKQSGLCLHDDFNKGRCSFIT